MNSPMKVALMVFMAGMILCLVVLFNISRARAEDGPPIPDLPSPEERAAFWEAVKAASLVNGKTGVNCCSWHDAVRIRLIHFDDETGESTVEITDTMISAYGKVGDIVRVPRGHNTTNIHNPYKFPILFVNSIGGTICLSGISGG